MSLNLVSYILSAIISNGLAKRQSQFQIILKYQVVVYAKVKISPDGGHKRKQSAVGERELGVKIVIRLSLADRKKGFLSSNPLINLHHR